MSYEQQLLELENQINVFSKIQDTYKKDHPKWVEYDTKINELKAEYKRVEELANE